LPTTATRLTDRARTRTTAVVLVLARSVSLVAVVGNAYLKTELVTVWIVRAEAANFITQVAVVYPLVGLLGAPGAALAILLGNVMALLTTLYAGFSTLGRGISARSRQ